MILDSEPPAYPEIVFRDQIVLGKLFQQSRTVETQYGIGKIRGFYVGVLNRGQDGTLQNDVETFSVDFPMTVEDVSRITGNFGFANTLGGDLTLYNESRGFNALASVFISGRVTVRRVRFGAVINTAGALRELTNPPLSELILSATVSFSVALPVVAQVATAFGLNTNNAQTLNQQLAALKTPADWLAAFPLRFAISSEQNNEILTPSVVVINVTNRLQTFSEPSLLYETPPAVA